MRLFASGTSALLLVAFVQGRELRGNDMELSSSNSWINVPSSGLTTIGCYKPPDPGAGTVHFLYDLSVYPTFDSVMKAASQKCISSSLFTAAREERQYRITCLRSLPHPSQRVSFGDCVPDEDKSHVPLIFRLAGAHPSGSCLPSAVAVQTRLANDGENSAPEGYDHISGSFALHSPFELLRDGCGTNVYAISTNAMASSSTLTTETNSVHEYSKKKSDKVSSSVKVGAEAGGWGVTAKVSAKSENEVTSVLESKGAESHKASVAESWGVGRTAVVGMSDFDNNVNFLTFSKTFHTALRNYKRRNFSAVAGRTILRDYGFLFPERVMYGGYYNSIATMDFSELKESYSSDQQKKDCYELAASLGGSGAGFSASVSVESSGCTEKQIAEMSAKAQSFKAESKLATSYGMEKSGSEYRTTPQSAILIRDPKLYQAAKANEQLQLRPITELLEPLKISPIMFTDSEMDEAAFDLIRKNLVQLVNDTLTEVGELFDDSNRLWYCYGGTTYLSKYDLPNAQYIRSCHNGKTIA